MVILLGELLVEALLVLVVGIQVREDTRGRFERRILACLLLSEACELGIDAKGLTGKPLSIGIRKHIKPQLLLCQVPIGKPLECVNP